MELERGRGIEVLEIIVLCVLVSWNFVCLVHFFSKILVSSVLYCINFKSLWKNVDKVILYLEKSSLIWNFSKRYHNPELNFPIYDLEFSDPSLSMSEKDLQTIFSLLSVSWSRSPSRNSSPKFDPHDKGNFYYFS